jgi:hypothetical protein
MQKDDPNPLQLDDESFVSYCGTVRALTSFASDYLSKKTTTNSQKKAPVDPAEQSLKSIWGKLDGYVRRICKKY